jgi:O-antigen/teichoic acid export membrane protein
MTLRRNAVANYVGQGWTTAMGLVFIPVYIRYVGLEAFGLVGVFAVLQAWLSVLDLGLAPTLNREMARYSNAPGDVMEIRDLLRSIEIATFGIAAVTSGAVWGLSGWLARDWLRAERLPPEVVAPSIALIGVVVALRLVENIYRSSMIGLQRQVVLNVVSSVMATLRGAGAVAVLAFVSPTIITYFVWQVVISAATTGALAIVVHRALPGAHRRARFNVDRLRGIWRFAAGAVLVTLLGFALSQSDKVMLSRLLSLSQFAVYSLAYTVASSVRLLVQPLDQAVFPRLTQLFYQEDEAGLARLYHKSAQYNAVLMGGVGVFLTAFGEPILRVWTQNAALAHDIFQVLWILVPGMVLNGIMNGPYNLQMAAGWTGLLVRVNAALVVVFIPTTYLLTRQFGMRGAATSWVLLNALYVAIVARLMHQRLLKDEMRAWYTHDLLMPLGASAAAALALRPFAPMQAGTIATIAFLAVAMVIILAVGSLSASVVRRDVTVQLRLTAPLS